MTESKKTRCVIIGYGSVGPGVEMAFKDAKNSDMELVGIFTRREPESIETVYDENMSKVYPLSTLWMFEDKADVAILCGGSKEDLPVQGPQILGGFYDATPDEIANILNTLPNSHGSKGFNCVCSMDTHKLIPNYKAIMNAAGKSSGKLAIVSTGWDPGLMSLYRYLFSSFVPNGVTYSGWGFNENSEQKGLSQGHTNAITKSVPGVKYGVQYTIRLEEGVQMARNMQEPNLKQKQMRECWIVPHEGADLDAIRETIVTMPEYFADYNTVVNFITEEEIFRDHTKKEHQGLVIHQGFTGDGRYPVTLESLLTIGDNPSFTGGILLATARACHSIHQEGVELAARGYSDVAKELYTGARDVFEVEPFRFSSIPPDEATAKFM